MAALALALVLFRCWLVKPLRRYAEDMQNDRKLSRQGRIRELWSMAAVYNEVPERRDTLESYLRAAAETDVLTGLPNRYHLEQNTGDLEKWDGTLAVLLFDVNFLKRVNDTRGHLAGDQLLRRTAHIIGECFGTESCANCYRIGGDEFAAILRDCTEADVLERMDAFARAQEREGISVSVGCAIDENTDAHTFRRLMELADRRMYEQKQRAHRLVAR